MNECRKPECSAEKQEIYEEQKEKIMEIAMRAGHILLENGAEISRVEETIDRICRHYGIESANSFIRSDLRRCWQSHFYTIQRTFSCTVPPPCSSTGKSTSDPVGLYFACAPSGKMILFTKKKITMEMPPLSTVVPML